MIPINPTPKNIPSDASKKIETHCRCGKYWCRENYIGANAGKAL
jgi:hypothetical protein